METRVAMVRILEIDSVKYDIENFKIEPYSLKKLAIELVHVIEDEGS